MLVQHKSNLTRDTFDLLQIAGTLSYIPIGALTAITGLIAVRLVKGEDLLLNCWFVPIVIE